ncbi:DUF2608 domain-containing protein [Paraglaciecola aestuariivivens]
MFHPVVCRIKSVINTSVLVLALTSVSVFSVSAKDGKNNTQENLVSKIVEIKDLKKATDQAKLLPFESTLVILDIDDTLLTASEFFGSDKWYDWQRGRALQPNGQAQPISEQDKVACLFDVLGMTYEIASNIPTQANMQSLVAQVQQDLLILTARSGNYRAATMRELNRNGIDLKTKALTAKDQGLHYPKTHNGRTATLSYVDGVFMVQGMDKGVMLLDLLKRLNKSYQAVVFVDDKSHNINNMANALKSAGIDYYGFKYTRVDKTVSSQEVKHAQAAANDLMQLLQQHFTDRYQAITKGQCAY